MPNNSRRPRGAPQACRQTFLPQHVPVAQTQPCWQSLVEVQSGRGVQDSLGPQKPVPSAVSKQKQLPPQLLRLLQVDPAQTGAEHWALMHTPEGHFAKKEGCVSIALEGGLIKTLGEKKGERRLPHCHISHSCWDR
jgi:hypothetical protein